MRNTIFYILCFYFIDTPTTEIYTLSLHDALPIFLARVYELDRILEADDIEAARLVQVIDHRRERGDRKSTRLNSSHQIISYAVFCLKKKNNITYHYNSSQSI